jgi:hypothetical protein
MAMAMMTMIVLMIVLAIMARTDTTTTMTTGLPTMRRALSGCAFKRISVVSMACTSGQ